MDGVAPKIFFPLYFGYQFSCFSISFFENLLKAERWYFFLMTELTFLFNFNSSRTAEQLGGGNVAFKLFLQTWKTKCYSGGMSDLLLSRLDFYTRRCLNLAAVEVNVSHVCRNSLPPVSGKHLPGKTSIACPMCADTVPHYPPP